MPPVYWQVQEIIIMLVISKRIITLKIVLLKANKIIPSNKSYMRKHVYSIYVHR